MPSVQGFYENGMLQAVFEIKTARMYEKNHSGLIKPDFLRFDHGRPFAYFFLRIALQTTEKPYAVRQWTPLFQADVPWRIVV